MKIAFTGLDLPEGKVKYNDAILADLEEMFDPDKVTPFYFELLPDDYETAEGIAITAERVLDLLILDMDKIEGRLSVAEDESEKAMLGKCLAHLETEQPVCDLELDDAEREFVNGFGLMSFKPTMIFEDASVTTDAVCEAVMAKADVMFFYTAGKKEVHAWFVEKNAAAVSCAGKIHTDLARGFIKAEIVSHEELMTAHNFKDAGAKGLTKLVDADFPIPEKMVLDIRFNV
jgi:ribosome-binding ATPase YchF (GTP1/OBG family)